MNEMPSFSTKILIEIRDEMKGMRDEMKGMRSDIQATNERLDATREELSGRLDLVARRQVESEVRLATELVAVTSAVKQLTQVYRDISFTR